MLYYCEKCEWHFPPLEVKLHRDECGKVTITDYKFNYQDEIRKIKKARDAQLKLAELPCHDGEDHNWKRMTIEYYFSYCEKCNIYKLKNEDVKLKDLMKVVLS